MSFFFFLISDDYCQKSYNGFRGFLGSSTTLQIFLIHTFLTMKWRSIFFFLNLHGNTFFSLFFLKERNIAMFLLMIHLKCTVVHYANLNSNFLNKPFLNYGSLNMLHCFFNFLFMLTLRRLLSKILWNNYHFLIQISEINFKM